MAKKSGYLQKQQEKMKALQQATKETWVQYIFDMVMITLNDPEYMGGDAFGTERIIRVMNGITENYLKYESALVAPGGVESESGFTRSMLDENLKKIIGENGFQEFEKRYEWLKYVI